MSEKKDRLNPRQKRFAKRYVETGNAVAAARAAGYTELTAQKAAYAMLQRPLVRSALTEAMERLGLTLEKIAQPVVDAMGATKVLTTAEGEVIDTEVPDHKIRLEAHDRIVALYGGVPKVGEATPIARGLNLHLHVSGSRTVTNILNRQKGHESQLTEGRGERMLKVSLTKPNGAANGT